VIRLALTGGVAAGLVASALTAGVARAQHDHHHPMAMDDEQARPPPRTVGVSLLAASYETMAYIGQYQGLVARFDWQEPRWGAGASLGTYRLEANGLTRYGIGDVELHGRATLYRRARTQLGAMASVTIPTGDGYGGFGMGHVMAMPMLWAGWGRGRVDVAVSAGYGRALVDSLGSHDHGAWPLVAPMNMSEIMWGTGADVALGRGFSTGVGLTGGVPVGGMGHQRLVGSGRAGYTSGAVSSGVELQAGLVGDPFTVRGVLTTRLQF